MQIVPISGQPIDDIMLQPVAVALGNFDGVHKGHQLLLRRDVDLAQELGAIPAVCTFYPHPVKFHKRDIELICTQEDKYGLLERYGAEICFVVNFDAHFSSLSPEEFVEKYLVRRMYAKAVVVGSDYNFGKNRSGNAEVLQKLCAEKGIRCEIIQQLTVEGAPVSSSRIRKVIQTGRYEDLPPLLGRYMEYTGIVGHGEKLGRKIGFPTANLMLDNEALPPDGIFTGYMDVEGKTYPVMAYMGTRPTVTDSPKRGFEVNIIGLPSDKSLYDEKLTVTITKKIRDDIKFASVDELTAQLAKDRQAALEVFNG